MGSIVVDPHSGGRCLPAHPVPGTTGYLGVKALVSAQGRKLNSVRRAPGFGVATEDVWKFAVEFDEALALANPDGWGGPARNLATKRVATAERFEGVSEAPLIP